MNLTAYMTVGQLTRTYELKKIELKHKAYIFFRYLCTNSRLSRRAQMHTLAHGIPSFPFEMILNIILSAHNVYK